MIKKLLVLISYIFKNNIDKVGDNKLTKIECNYCEAAFKPIRVLEVCKIDKIYFELKIRDEL
jgi:hypothetical protein